jgi:hypothetical protein
MLKPAFLKIEKILSNKIAKSGQSDRGDGGVTLSEFSIRLCPRFFMIFSILDQASLRVLVDVTEFFYDKRCCHHRRQK